MDDYRLATVDIEGNCSKHPIVVQVARYRVFYPESVQVLAGTSSFWKIPWGCAEPYFHRLTNPRGFGLSLMHQEAVYSCLCALQVLLPDTSWKNCEHLLTFF